MTRSILVVAVSVFLTQPAWAQPGTVDFGQPPAMGPSPVRVALGRAEDHFRRGASALTDGRASEAQQAFDAALDVFLTLDRDPATDSATHSAYRNLIDRINALEVAAGPLRKAFAEAPIAAPAGLQASRGVASERTEISDPQPESNLAEMGDRLETIQPTEEERRSTAAVLGMETIDLPIELNDQVLGAIDLYSGKFRKWFSSALSRGIPHLPRIREILAAAGIPQDLAYVPIVESAFNPSALSRAKARGLWQFIPSTGKQYGLKQDFFIDERADIEKATIAAAQYLKNLYAMFGDWNLALAGYNAGEGNVQRAIRRAQTNDFWALAKTRSFRAETKNYVPLIHAAIVIAKSPESYGIDLLPEELTPSERIRVAGSYPVSTVARCANTEAAEIRRLNPALRRGITPSSAFDLDVPHGSGAQVTECLASEPTLSYARHAVRKHDTLSLISKMFGVSSEQIARANGLTVRSMLKPGTELVIPQIPRAALAKTASAKSSTDALGGDSYRIRKGDTLSSVAARHSTTVEAIKTLNGLRSSHLSIGQVLRVSSSSADGSTE